MSNAQWELVYARIAELVERHSTTLVFVNTRRMAERAARHLGELLGKRGRAPRLARQGIAAGRGAEAQARRTEGAGRHRLAGTGHRHRRHRPGLPDRFAAQHRRVPAARGPRRPPRRRRAQGTPVPDLARRTAGKRGACSIRSIAAKFGRADHAAGAAGRARAAGRGRGRLPRMGRGCAVRAGAPRPCAALPRKVFDEVVRMLADGFSTRYGQRAVPASRRGPPRLRGRRARA